MENYYLISNKVSGLTLGIYAGNNEEEAYRAMLQDAGEPDQEITYDIKILKLEEYEPADQLNPTTAGIYRENNYWRATCDYGRFTDGANCLTRQDAKMVLKGMLS